MKMRDNTRFIFADSAFIPTIKFIHSFRKQHVLRYFSYSRWIRWRIWIQFFHMWILFLFVYVLRVIQHIHMHLGWQIADITKFYILLFCLFILFLFAIATDPSHGRRTMCVMLQNENKLTMGIPEYRYSHSV